MTSPADFLRAAGESPEDEAHRLVLADWLEERGDDTSAARAELIRVQCELARWVPDLRRRTQLQQREAGLLARHGEEWLGELRPFCLSWRFERGLAQVTLDAPRIAGRKFATRARALLEGARVETVRLETDAATWAAGLATARHLAFVGVLDLDGNGFEDGALEGLLGCRHLGGLARLDLGNNALTDHAARALASSPLWGRLTGLDLRNNRLTGDGVRALLAAATPRLRRLDLHGNDIDPATLQALADRRQRGQKPGAGGLPAAFTNSAGMELALVPAGTFLMGSPGSEDRRRTNEGPQHEVTITRPFYLGVYPVTQRQYQAVMGSNPAHFGAANGGGPDNPVENVSWNDALAFCRRLSALPAESSGGRTYRLPTEAEWEHACRAGTSPDLPFPWGTSASSLQANFNGEYPYGGAPPGPYLWRTTPAGSYPANPWGLYDVLGNLWEWCADWYAESYYRHSPGEDPPGPPRGRYRVLRGGCWSVHGWHCRTAYRVRNTTGHRSEYYGFRVAATAG